MTDSLSGKIERGITGLRKICQKQSECNFFLGKYLSMIEMKNLADFHPSFTTSYVCSYVFDVLLDMEMFPSGNF